MSLFIAIIIIHSLYFVDAMLCKMVMTFVLWLDFFLWFMNAFASYAII